MALASNVQRFQTELEHLINKYSMESGSDTRDFVLARFMCGCLQSYNHALEERERLAGRCLIKDMPKATIEGPG